jgi:hypothetical protein
MRRALLVGIDDYPNAPLNGCVNDANRIGSVLARHDDGSPNFECRKCLSSKQMITRASLRKYVEELFAQPVDVVLFYFAAIHSKSCKITALGQFYWNLAYRDKL